MIYKVKWCESIKKGNTNGREWELFKMTLTDDQDNDTENVTTFDKVMSGQTIEGTITQTDRGLTFKKTLEKPNFLKHRDAQIEKVMDKKNESISHFQDKKEESIALAGAQRDAVLIVTQMTPDGYDNEDEIKQAIIKWRNWFLSEDFRLPPPF